MAGRTFELHPCDLGPPGRNAIEVKYLHTNGNASSVQKAHFLKANHNFTTTPTRELAAEITLTRTSITTTTSQLLARASCVALELQQSPTANIQVATLLTCQSGLP